LWDSHCHLADPGWGAHLEHRLREARALGIRGWLSCAYDPSSWQVQRSLLELPGVHIAQGVHPWAAELWGAECQALLRQELERGQVVALGECGLDFYRARQPEAQHRQLEALRGQLQLARELDLPVVLHSVRCHRDLLREFDAAGPLRAMVHGFLGSLPEARDWIERGCYLSLGPHALSRVDLMKQLPRQRVLIETDAPSRGAGLCDLIGVSQAYRQHHPQGSDELDLNLHRFLEGS